MCHGLSPEEFREKVKSHDHFLTSALKGRKHFVKGGRSDLDEMVGNYCTSRLPAINACAKQGAGEDVAGAKEQKLKQMDQQQLPKQ
jgi:hypothetical protein